MYSFLAIGFVFFVFMIVAIVAQQMLLVGVCAVTCVFCGICVIGVDRVLSCVGLIKDYFCICSLVRCYLLNIWSSAVNASGA